MLLIGAVMAASCSDFLDQSDPNKVSTSGFFHNENDVLKAINGVYQGLRSGNALGEGSTQYIEERSDNIANQDNQSSNGNQFQFADYSLLATNPNVKNFWTGLYTVVARANFVLSHIDEVTFADQNLYKEYLAEAKFLRATAYFHLVRIWGDVPFSTKQIASFDELEAHTHRESKAVVYAQIVRDLTEALDSGSLPVLQGADGKGRTCKAAVAGLLGQVYLTMATTLEGADRAADLRQAQKYLTDCYNMRTFGSLSEIPYSEVFDVAKKGTCPELIFQIVYVQGDQNYYSGKARSNQPRDMIGTISKFKSTGVSFLPGDIIREYEKNDPRTEWSVMWSEESNSHFISKFRDLSDSAGELGYGGNDWIVMRYADIMLLLAETEMLLGNDAAATALLDEVRARAGMPSYAAMQSDADYSAKYPTLKLAILHERRIELAFENHRWYDLLRCFTIGELQAYMHAKERNDFGRTNPHNFGPKDLYFPIPFDEWKLDPEKMYQNAGY
jgi:hypothetical protein